MCHGCSLTNIGSTYSDMKVACCIMFHHLQQVVVFTPVQCPDYLVLAPGAKGVVALCGFLVCSV